MPNKMDRFVSLGQACQVTHQLRRLGKGNETFFFDWIVTEHRALLNAIPMVFDRILCEEDLSLASNKKSIFDKSSGLRFYPHDFPGPDGNILEDYISLVPDVRSRYLRRAGRTRQIFQSKERVVLIRHGYDTEICKFQEEIDEIKSKFSECYSETDFAYVWVSFSEIGRLSSANEIYIRVNHGPDWKGSDVSWDRVMEEIGDL